MMKIKGGIVATVFLAAYPAYLYSEPWKKNEGKRMEVTGIEVRVIASAYRLAEDIKMDLDKYKLYLTEEERTYTASFVDRERPPGFRGSREGFPQPTLIIDKASGVILEKTFSR